MATRWIIGLSSGSSMDGVDAALVEIEGVGLDLRFRLLHFHHQGYADEVCTLLGRVGSVKACSAQQACLLHRWLGETLAAAARQVADQASFNLQKVQCVGCPGHTVWHEPEGRWPSTLSMGMASVVAERTGLTVISDFRERDLAVGGQGYPLTALVDYFLFHHPAEHRVLVHLGSVATVVSLPPAPGDASDPKKILGPRGSPAAWQVPPELGQVLGFQAAPCNVLLDGLIRQATKGRATFDAGGKHAVQGCCIESLLQRWLGHPAMQRRPPKVLARHGFGEEFMLQLLHQAQRNCWSLHDLLCTATHFVARGIVQALERFLPQPPTRVLLSGGGVRNGLLWHLLEQHLRPVPLEKVDQYGIPALARKAVANAGLASLTLDGVPANISSVTGASGPRLLGSLTPGSSANWARCLSWMAAQTPPLPLAA